MSVNYLKRAEKVASASVASVSGVVAQILAAVKAGGEAAAREYGRRFDNWDGDIIMTKDHIKAAREALSAQARRDIEIAHKRVRAFARAQRDSCHDVELTVEGVTMGHRRLPLSTAGCYVPGGRYGHIASAIMSITTAKVAGVKNVIACSPARKGVGIHPAVLYTMDLCGADTILALGGAQAIAALAYGLFTGLEADIVVGPGNAYVTEAKRQLFGQVGIDLLAGPTEIAIIADESTDPLLVAVDLVSQAEHGPDSPAWLITTSAALAAQVCELVPGLIEQLPPPARAAAEAAWRDHGEIAICSSREEAVALSDQYGAEHLEILARDLDWWHAHLTNYGSLFLGAETTVTYGDKVTGPNHILPTRRAARYTGGLNVNMFRKALTYQRMTPAASVRLGRVAARISRAEGMEAHARAADLRVERYTAG